VVAEAIGRLTGGGNQFEPEWYAFVVIGLALGIDISRVLVSLHGAARYKSAARRSNAFHFAGDMVGSLAVLAGLVAVSAGFHQGDSVAALIVAAVISVAPASHSPTGAARLAGTSAYAATVSTAAASRPCSTPTRPAADSAT
jgi:divalent metal cation (Fe/Co/Zn/Cd) transporter